MPQALVNETFTHATAPGWTLSGSACLTAASGCITSADADGSGWLRLTGAVNSQAGSAIYNTAFSSSNGTQITFDYADYGGSGADGFTFYLIDGATTLPTTGAAGPGLGYARWISLSQPGVTNGYAGIGFDEWGNYETADAGACTSIACLSTSSGNRQYVALRGSGSLTSGFNYLQGVALLPANRVDNVTRGAPRHVRISLTPAPAPIYITVEMDLGSGYQKMIDHFNLSGASGQSALPATFKMGFSASTGGFNNIHEIRNLVVGGAQPSVIHLHSSLNPAYVGDQINFTATVTDLLGAAYGTGSVTIYDGAVSIGTGYLDSYGVALFQTTTLSSGQHSISAVYNGDATFVQSTSNTVIQVVNPTAPDNDADLGGLDFKGSMPTIAFSPSVLKYEVTFLADLPSFSTYASGEIVATLDNPSATFTINGRPTSSGTIFRMPDLSLGDTTFSIVVKAPDGLTTKTYTVLVHVDDPRSCITSFLAGASSTGQSSASSLFRAAASNFDLQTFYTLRDKVLGETPQGHRYIQLYYDNNVDIMEALAKNPALVLEGINVLQTWAPIVQTLSTGQSTTTIITADQVQMVKIFLDHLSVAGSPALQQVIANEETLTPLDQFIGKSVEQARAMTVGYGVFVPMVLH